MGNRDENSIFGAVVVFSTGKVSTWIYNIKSTN